MTGPVRTWVPEAAPERKSYYTYSWASYENKSFHFSSLPLVSVSFSARTPSCPHAGCVCSCVHTSVHVCELPVQQGFQRLGGLPANHV